MLNHVVIMGRLTGKPETRHVGNGTPVTSFTLACDRDFKNQNGERSTDFIDCVAWRNTAEFIQKYFDKGRMMVASGRLQKRDYEASDGSKRYVTEIVVDNAYFGDSQSAARSNNVNELTEPDEPQPAVDGGDVDDSRLPF